MHKPWGAVTPRCARHTQPEDRCMHAPLPTASISKTTWTKDVYEPSDDTFLLTDALERLARDTWSARPPATVVEVGCGSGFVICSAALMLAHLGLAPSTALLAVDHSGAALEATRQTLAAHGVAPGRVRLVEADLCGSWQDGLQGQVDLLLFNPPYVPTPDEELQRAKTGVASTWAGGHLGRRVIDRLLPHVPALLSPGGSMLMIAVSENDPQGIIRAMQEQHGLTGQVVLSRQADEESLCVVQLTRPAT